MNKIITVACAALAFFAMPGAQAGGINDNVTTGGYWGADGHGYGDIIGDSKYDISGATITRIGSVLTIMISTNFAGQAGADANIVQGGIGYGDVFLANAWNPKGSAADHYGLDNAATGTNWQYGLNLDNRMNNTGGNFKLYKLPGMNAASILNSESFITCITNCTYRNGQAVAVNTAAGATDAYVVKRGSGSTEVGGTWKVFADLHQIEFKLDMAGTDLINFNSFAMHWGETCQNDVIEGLTSVVALPGSMPLLMLGLGAMLFMRRRQPGRATLS
jgi:hypothetical protein